MISREDVEHVARLTRLHLTPGEAEQMQAQLSGILAYIDTLRTLDVEAVEPTSHAVPLVNVMREDEPRPGLSQEEALREAPEVIDGMFAVVKFD